MYKNCYRKIGGYPCVSRLIDTKEWDDTLAGPKGEIWPCGTDGSGYPLYRAFCVDKKGNEEISTFKYQLLSDVIFKLGVPLSPAEQGKWANGVYKRDYGKTKRKTKAR